MSVPMSVERAQQILDGHNCHRARYGVAPLQWDWNLAEGAKQHALECKFQHTDASTLNSLNLGENLAASQASANESQFFDEEPDWNCGKTIGNGDCKAGKQCNHYTQIVSNKSTKVGCAITNCSSWPPGNYLVCRYSPAGNVLGTTPTASCNPNPSINCSNLQNANFPRPVVPSLPVGGQGGGGGGGQAGGSGGQAGETTVPKQTIPPLQPIPNTKPVVPNKTQEEIDAEKAKNAAIDAQKFQDQLAKDALRVKQQQEQENQLVVNGVAISFLPSQKSAVMGLTDERKQELAERLRQIDPMWHPNVIAQYLADKAQEDANKSVIHPRDSQIQVLKQLSAKQFQDMYQQVKDYPIAFQGCGIEEYLVQQGLAQPTDLCIQWRATLTPSTPTPSTTVPPSTPTPSIPTPPPTTAPQGQGEGLEGKQGQGEGEGGIDIAQTKGEENITPPTPSENIPAPKITEKTKIDTTPLPYQLLPPTTPFIHPSEMSFSVGEWIGIAAALLFFLLAISTMIYVLVQLIKRQKQVTKAVLKKEDFYSLINENQ